MQLAETFRVFAPEFSLAVFKVPQGKEATLVDEEDKAKMGQYVFGMKKG
jgi:hypothetical protein